MSRQLHRDELELATAYERGEIGRNEYYARKREIDRSWIAEGAHEMHDALVADGEKLMALTGQDHGPEFLVACPDCCGEGGHDEPEPLPDDPYRTRHNECVLCGGSGLLIDEPATSRGQHG